MIRAILIILALALPTAAAAGGPDRLSILLASHHSGARVPFKVATPGVFATWEDRALGLDWSIGAYRNSYGRPSVAGLAALPVWRRGQTQVSLFAGAAYYPRDGRTFRVSIGDVVPIGGVQLRHRGLFVQIMPSDGRAARAVISTGVTMRWPLSPNP